MKNQALKLFSLLSAAFLASTSFAQQDTARTAIGERPRVKIEVDTVTKQTTADTTRISVGNTEVTIITKSDQSAGSSTTAPQVRIGSQKRRGSKAELTWWNGIDLGVNGILNSNYDTGLGDDFGFLEPQYGSSRYIGFNFAAAKLRLVGDYVGLTTGLTFQIYNFKYSGDESLVMGDELSAFPTDTRNVRKSKLRTSYLGLPLMLEFNTSLNPRKSLHVTAGVIGKVRIDNMYKEKFREDGSNFKTTQKGDLGLNRWGADAVVRLGYGWVTVFAQAGLLPLFDNDNTPDLYSFAAGIAFNIH